MDNLCYEKVAKNEQDLANEVQVCMDMHRRLSNDFQKKYDAVMLAQMRQSDVVGYLACESDKDNDDECQANNAD